MNPTRHEMQATLQRLDLAMPRLKQEHSDTHYLCNALLRLADTAAREGATGADVRWFREELWRLGVRHHLRPQPRQTPDRPGFSRD